MPDVRVTEIGEYLRHHSCERRFKLEANGRQAARALPFAERLFNALDPVLQEIGRMREDAWEQSIKDDGFTDLTRHLEREPRNPASWDEFTAALANVEVGERAYGREVRVRADLGAWTVEGRIDFVIVEWVDGTPYLRLVECKASRRDRAYHRVQVALYREMVRRLLADGVIAIGGQPVLPANVRAVVARIDESTNEPQSILDLEPLDLDVETDDLRRLLADEGPLMRIRETELEALSYQLEPKCDGCVFSVHCFPESARQRKLQLIGLDPSSVRALRTAGVNSIDDLANLDLAGEAAQQVRHDPSFVGSLERLLVEARARSMTLPGGGAVEEAHEVMALPYSGDGQLPQHVMDQRRLVRVYLSVSYDYAENRIGAIAAHVTQSEFQLHTAFVQDENGQWAPDPVVRERRATGQRDENDRMLYEERELQSRDVIRFKTSEWSGDYNQDTAAERELVQQFLHELIDTIAHVAESPTAPIHFYVWSRSEMTQLVEACSRAGSRLLGALRELLGCRDSLEQLIYSSLQEEIDRRYGLGWTGRGLSVATSLTWFGRRYHWRRRIAGQLINLDWEFTQDIFDFKSTLELRQDGTWAEEEGEGRKHRFEIRSRFHDSLTAPYWRAFWDTLPDPETPGFSPATVNALRRYARSASPGFFSEYLRARAHALRWMEEGVRFKNAEILKPNLDIAQLRRFELDVHNAAQAGIDFLRLDQHVKTTKWIGDHLLPVADRVSGGRTLALRDVTSDGQLITATIVTQGYGVGLGTLESRCSLAEGGFARLAPHTAGDPNRGQTIGQLVRGGRTCKVRSINWQNGRVVLEPIFSHPGRYVLQSGPAGAAGPVFDFATIDESISDFVAGRVDMRLQSGRAAYVYQWFDPERPQLPAQQPIAADRLAQLRQMLEALPVGNQRRLTVDQVDAVLVGLGTRVQLLQGPPGTGKTSTTSASALTRILTRRQIGDIVVVAAHTHTAVNTLLLRIDDLLPEFARHCSARNLNMPTVRLAKVHTSEVEPDAQPGGTIVDFSAKRSFTRVNRMRQDAVLVIGGTTSAILKLAAELSQRNPFSQLPDGFQVPTLIVDESSMMVFPHFLSLASLVTVDGEIMLAGDHRQLSPIIAHDWEREDRPPAVLYQPFASAYEAVQRIKGLPGIDDARIKRSALRYTFRLPPEVLELIARLYRKDEIELRGRDVPGAGEVQLGQNPWEVAWTGATGLFLVVHSERESRQANPVEVSIIEQLLHASGAHGAQPAGSVAVVTPHRAQRSLLRNRLGQFYGDGRAIDVIDTVERLQGNERPTVIVSATASDSSAIGRNVEFILNLNRANVAFSRTEERLVVVCSETLLDHMPVEVEHYDSAFLWKSLRGLCTREVAVAGMDGHRVRILTPSAEALREAAEGDQPAPPPVVGPHANQ
jgi:hypothetical protein